MHNNSDFQYLFTVQSETGPEATGRVTQREWWIEQEVMISIVVCSDSHHVSNCISWFACSFISSPAESQYVIIVVHGLILSYCIGFDHILCYFIRCVSWFSHKGQTTTLEHGHTNWYTVLMKKKRNATYNYSQLLIHDTVIVGKQSSRSPAEGLVFDVYSDVVFQVTFLRASFVRFTLNTFAFCRAGNV